MRSGAPRRLTKWSGMTNPDEQLPDEQSLLAAARAGDPQAVGRLVDGHRAGLEQFCWLMLGDRHDAACVLDDAVLCAWREIQQEAPSASARIWLYRIAMDACLENPDTRR